MESIRNKVLCASDLKEVIKENQSIFVFRKIFEAAKEFKTSACISSEIKLREGVIDYLKELGYQIRIRFYADDVKSEYKYIISWE